MSRYRQLHCKLWNDSKFLELSDDAKLLWFQLLTSYYSNQIGLYKAPLAALAAEIGWKTERLSKGFRELFQKGFINYDERVSLVFIKNFIRYNPPANPNVVLSWAALLEELPESALVCEWIQIVREHLKGFSEPFRKAFERVTETLSKGFREPFGKGMPKQEQEQEQEQEYVCDSLRSSHTVPQHSAGAEDAAGPDNGKASLESLNPSVIKIPVVKPAGEYPISADDVEGWKETFPAVDVIGELRKMREWCLANPQRRKTSRGVRRFIINWLSRAQDRGPPKHTAQQRADPWTEWERRLQEGPK